MNEDKLLIYKYVLSVEDNFTVNLPWGYQILSFQLQNRMPVIWAAVNPSHATNPVMFKLIGTGYECPVGYVYIGTIQMDGFVWHLFKEPGN